MRKENEKKNREG